MGTFWCAGSGGVEMGMKSLILDIRFVPERAYYAFRCAAASGLRVPLRSRRSLLRLAGAGGARARDPGARRPVGAGGAALARPPLVRDEMRSSIVTTGIAVAWAPAAAPCWRPTYAGISRGRAPHSEQRERTIMCRGVSPCVGVCVWVGTQCVRLYRVWPRVWWPRSTDPFLYHTTIEYHRIG